MLRVVRSLADLPRGVPIYIYGSGDGGRKLRRACRRDTEIRVMGFLDSFRSGELDGLPIHKASEFFAADPTSDNTIVVASAFGEDIKKHLVGLGVNVVYDAYPMILRITAETALRRRRRRAAILTVGIVAVLTVVWLA